MCVYMLENKRTGDIYVGKTEQTLRKRFANHKPLQKMGGLISCNVSILARASNADELSSLEADYIQMYDTIEHGLNTQQPQTKNTWFNGPALGLIIMAVVAPFMLFGASIPPWLLFIALLIAMAAILS